MQLRRGLPGRHYEVGRQLMNSTPVSLLESLRERPEAAGWQRFVQIYEPWLQGRLRNYGVAEADADDLIQDVMTVLLREIPQFQHNGRRGAFRIWLRGILVNRLRELWRERKHRPQVGGSDFDLALNQLADDRSQLSQLWDREHDQHVATRLLRLIAGDFEPVTWQAFRAFVLEGRKAAAVAAELGISEGAVWTAKSHVLKRLRQVAKNLLD